MRYTFDDVETQFAPEVFERGWRLFEDGRIGTLNIQRGGEVLAAIIRGTGTRDLRIYVRTTESRRRRSFHGECTCAKRTDCEHIVAVLLSALAEHDLLPEALPDKPPKHTGMPASAGRRSESAPSQVLLYLLHLESGDLQVETIVARSGPGGGFIHTRRFDPAKLRHGLPPRFLQAADVELLKALDRLARGDSSAVRLAGADTDALLRAMLATERTHLASHAGFAAKLSIGAARPLELGWFADEAGVQHVAPSIEPPAHLLRPITSRWYLDGETGECGPLTSALSMAAIDALIDHPPVAPEQVAETRAALAAACPGEPLPLPVSFEVETLPPVEPVACLELITENADETLAFVAPRDYARPSFDYGGIIFNPDAPDTRLVDGRVIRVQRHRDFERSAVERLFESGLEIGTHSDRYEDGALRLVPAGTQDGYGHDDIAAWLDFQIDGLPELRDHGWRIVSDGFRFAVVEAGGWTCAIEALPENDWFGVGLGIEVNGKTVDLLPLLLKAFGELPFDLVTRPDRAPENLIVPLDAGFDEGDGARMLSLPTARLAPLLHMLLEFYGNRVVDPDAPLRLSRVQLARLSALDPPATDTAAPIVQWLGDRSARQLIERLRDVDSIPVVEPPAGLNAQLRPYQRAGLDWLQFLRTHGFGGILADDMGLGKTLQALAHLLVEKESGRADRPSLVVAPTSLMFNWQAEAQRFAPQLKVLVLQGPERKDRFGDIARYDLVLTTYPLLARDHDALLAHAWHLLILDEAQVIKNPKAQASQIARRVDARHRLCLTGTPMENHLGELWSLFDILLPGLLADRKTFGRVFRTPIEKHADDAVADRLRRRVRPFLLRRGKAQVAAELPDKTEIVHGVELAGRQRELYEAVRLSMHRRVREEIERQGLARSHIVVLDALLKLRQACCDPRLIDSEQARAVGASAKLEALMEMLPEMVEEGRRILLFSQFTTMLGLIEAAVTEAGIDYVKLTGRTRDRETPVKRFQTGEVPLFLISLKAGGVGLNLTAADTVIHYDPWWNPAVERQATDRAHRIGQRQAVFVYKLICAGTVEEKIQAMQQRKQRLADGLYDAGGAQGPQWRREDLDELFGPVG